MRFQMKSNLLYYSCFIIISCFTLRANAQRSTWTLFSSTQDKTANELKSDPQQKKILGLSFGKKSPRVGGFASAEILEDDGEFSLFFQQKYYLIGSLMATVLAILFTKIRSGKAYRCKFSGIKNFC